MVLTSGFELRVKDVFHFSNGQTVLVGLVEKGPAFIPSQACELLVDGEYRQRLRLEGEMMPSTQHGMGYRSVSTTESVNLKSSEPLEHICVLVLCRIHSAMKDSHVGVVNVVSRYRLGGVAD